MRERVQLIARLVDGNVGERSVRDTVRSEAHALALEREDSCRALRSGSSDLVALPRVDAADLSRKRGSTVASMPRARSAGQACVSKQVYPSSNVTIRGFSGRFAVVRALRGSIHCAKPIGAITPREQRIQLLLELCRPNVALPGCRTPFTSSSTLWYIRIVSFMPSGTDSWQRGMRI